MATTAFLQKAYLAYFGRPVDATGAIAFQNTSEAAVQAAFAASPESQALYGATFGVTQVNAIYQTLFGRVAEPAGLTYWVNQVAIGALTPAGAAVAILNGSMNADAIAIANKLVASAAFTAGLNTTPLIIGYTGDAAAASARAFLATVTATPAAQSAIDAAVNATAAVGATGTVGSTFTLTNGIDILTGTSGNDTFIADNTQTGAAGPGDQLNGGAGTDTFKLYIAAATAVDTLGLPQLNSIENLYIKSGTFTNTATADYSTIVGLNNIELDSPVALVNGATFTIKTAAAQTVKLDNVNTAAGTSKVALSAASGVTVNAVGTDTTNTGAVVIDVLSTTANSASIAAVGAASKVTFANAGAKVSALTITGDQNLTLIEGLTTLKTINASASTGKISVDASSITVDAAFAFAGGSGNDTLKLSQAGLDALAAGSQLVGGAGTDTLFITAAAALTFAAADYKAVNAATGFEILAINGAGNTATVDASQLTSIKEFAVSADTNIITKIATGSTLDINGGTTKTTVSGAVGVMDLVINIGTAASTTATTNTALDVTGLTNVTINSNIKAGIVGQSHAIGTLTASENSSFTIKGNGDLTLALAAAPVTTGSKIDGSAATGILTLTANGAAFNAAKTSLGDVIIGGSGNDVLKAGLNSTTLTGNAGNDTFDVSTALVAATTGVVNETVVTDFTKGDSLKFDSSFLSTSAYLKVDLTGLAAGQSDIAVLTALAAKGVTIGDVAYGVYNGNTYIIENTGASPVTSFTATDIAVKLTGTLDLSTSTHTATGVLVFA